MAFAQNEEIYTPSHALGRFNKREGQIIAWGMNTKGEVDIMVATLMFSLSIFSKEIFFRVELINKSF